MNRRIVVLLAMIMLPGAASRAQVPTQAQIVFPLEMGRTGVFRLSGKESELQLQARPLDAQGRPARGVACAPVWKSANPQVLTVVRTSGQSAYVKQQSEGITDLTVTYPCAPALSRGVAVVVGNAAIDKPFGSSGTEAAYYPARLQITPPGNAYVSGGRVYLRPIDKNSQFIASAFNGLKGRVNAAEFPMKWRVANPGVVAIAQQYDHTVFLNPVGNGTTTVTFTVEGLSQSFDVTVQDKNPASRDAASSLVTRSVAVSPVSLPITVRTGGGAFVALPITVKPSAAPTTPSGAGVSVALPITVKPSGAGTTPGGGATPTAPAAPVNAPVAPVLGQVGGLLLESPRTIAAPPLSITGTAVQLLSRSITSSPLVLAGTAVQLLNRSIASPPLVVAGTAIQLLSRSIIAAPLVLQGQ